MLALATTLDDEFLRLMNFLPFTRNMRTGWGPPCEHERFLGRHGICQFSFAQGAAARDFGADVLQAFQSSGRGPAGAETGQMQTQFLFDWADPAVSVPQIQQLYKTYPFSQPSQPQHTSACILPQDGVHSYLSRYDNPDQNKWWLGEMSCRVAAFLTQHQQQQHQQLASSSSPALDANGFLAVSPVPDPDPKHASWSRCAFDCTNTTCGYNRTEKIDSCPFLPPPPQKWQQQQQQRQHERVPSSLFLSAHNAAVEGDDDDDDDTQAQFRRLSSFLASSAASSTSSSLWSTSVLDFACFLQCCTRRCGQSVPPAGDCLLGCAQDPSCQYTPSWPPTL
jgi:hypothetical protein